MSNNRLAALISHLFAEDRKQKNLPAGRVKKRLADLWKKAKTVMKATKGDQT